MAATATPGVIRTRNRILVASADPLFRDRVKRSSVYADAMSEEAVGGAHALAKLLQWPCDGVLLDRNLPDLDAQEVAEQIRKQYPQIEVELVDPGAMAGKEEKVEERDTATAEEAASATVVEEIAGETSEAIEAASDECESGCVVAETGTEMSDHTEVARIVEPLPGMIGASRAMEQVYRLMTNVVDVYINYLRRKVDSGYERALIRTVRGVGYQIGGAAPAARSAAASSSGGGVTVV
jgi:two-component system, OmpR family, copper resistance phosphate regulon response regulator CusR